MHRPRSVDEFIKLAGLGSHRGKEQIAEPPVPPRPEPPPNPPPKAPAWRTAVALVALIGGIGLLSFILLTGQTLEISGLLWIAGLLVTGAVLGTLSILDRRVDGRANRNEDDREASK
jgi:hypothetical protein